MCYCGEILCVVATNHCRPTGLQAVQQQDQMQLFFTLFLTRVFVKVDLDTFDEYLIVLINRDAEFTMIIGSWVRDHDFNQTELKQSRI